MYKRAESRQMFFFVIFVLQIWKMKLEGVLHVESGQVQFQ